MCKVNLWLFSGLIFSLALFVSCGHSSGDDDGRMQAERDSLQVLVEENQAELVRMTHFFDEVAACIDSISEQEALLAVTVNPETNRRYSQREMSARLNQLSEIINGQRQRINELVDSLNVSTDVARMEGLSSTIAFLTSQLEKKEQRINELSAELRGERAVTRRLTNHVEALLGTVDSLEVQNTGLREAVTVQQEIINEGLVLVGTTESLKQAGVIEGGGLLRRQRVNLNRIDQTSCTRVDIAQFTGLTLNSTRVKLLTPAPQGSYTLTRQGGGMVLTITDPTAFWSLSNVLVIQLQ